MILSQLNDSQRIALKKFKGNVEDCKLADPSDEYLLTWLVARNFDVAQSEKMLRRSLEWREENSIDGILHQWKPPKVLLEYYPMKVVGHDKCYNPLWIKGFGQADWRGLLHSVNKRDFLRYVCYIAEQGSEEFRKCSQLAQRPITSSTFIIDMEELSMKQIAHRPLRDIGLEAIKVLEANYPEVIRKVFIINAPKLFTMVFSIVKPFLHQMTLDKINIFGFDKKEWSAALLKEIDAEQLPAQYGGTLTDLKASDPSKFTIGGEVPKSYYLKVVKPSTKSYMTSLSVSKGNKKKLEFQITTTNSLLKWEFMTEEADIGFSIYYLKANGEKGYLVTPEKIQSHLMMEVGEVNCTRVGTYIMEFDNSYSYIRSKNIWYRVVIDLIPTSPTEEFDGESTTHT
ncbi:hypothetical protein DAPPUDRAFT_300430 [Daphnia pulex]|uniref:CRAL-TRIO domain-containing protein n=1 Tax=Daphnia pulex TaxID=6669 RepID=E9G4U2_DAPPU|nr:hypothetical protein DAPPUDRAFT_300430 [Daphnia pulex]|eukprot:EFX85496.1 hypothetical protein DAPPUDRAFT_300430 [Daphnia pulex]